MDERSLLEDYLLHKTKVAHKEDELKSAKEYLRIAQERLIQYLSDRQMTSTGKYEDLGSVSLRSFNTYKVPEEAQQDLLKFIEDNGYQDVIKQSIHHKTLDRVLNELIEEGRALPEFVESYNVTTLQINK